MVVVLLLSLVNLAHVGKAFMLQGQTHPVRKRSRPMSPGHPAGTST